MYKPRILFNLDFWMKIVPLEFEIAWGKCNTQYSILILKMEIVHIIVAMQGVKWIEKLNWVDRVPPLPTTLA